jgi:hypothetical protein
MSETTHQLGPSCQHCSPSSLWQTPSSIADRFGEPQPPRGSIVWSLEFSMCLQGNSTIYYIFVNSSRPVTLSILQHLGSRTHATTQEMEVGVRAQKMKFASQSVKD